MSEWIKHDGGPCPVDSETEVNVRNAKNWRFVGPAWAFVWANIAAYRVIHPEKSP